ncbi:MAG: site-specific integrase [Levilactobacillus sp.]|jgi:integrase|uniref:tyrosine-type recombinase/integrase n=1 Tax=Levilactobacillus sp. TaxID=2767919 RepID=UPI002585D91E|nr:site-specific integrase [Levilactobacillus sp.]MCH4123952.1 site-specific integrase [Levilactobacillus sp.]MCI1554212.1 site-specific integrase [Levilactobacillus sp.]MCI1598796.1 site-specific integrase [Levilactobacillus sp.]MCI1605433.1 site-specific integrase [Levilactobacillus sp.]
MASIQKYHDKYGHTRYKVQVYLGIDPRTGKPQRTTRRGMKTAQEARLVGDHLKKTTTKQQAAKRKPKTFRDVYLRWFPLYQNTVKESTWATTQRLFRLHILPMLGDARIKQIDISDCQTAINTWFAAGLTKYHTLLDYAANVLDFAINLRLITDNPARRVIVPVNQESRAQKNLANYFDRAELKHFFACLNADDNDPQATVFFRLAAFSGMRKSEMLCLLWSDIDFERNTVTVSKTQSRGAHARLLVQSPKTFHSNRTVYLDAKTGQILRQWQMDQRHRLAGNANPRSQLIFTNTHNEMCQPTKPRKWLEHTLQKYGLKHITVHAFRHTYATLAFEAGASIKSVQDQLGHASYQTTLDLYTAVTAKEKNEATAKLARYLDF